MNVGMVFMASDAPAVAKSRFGLDDLEPGLELGNVDERKKKRERRTRMFPTDASGSNSSAGSSNNSSR